MNDYIKKFESLFDKDDESLIGTCEYFETRKYKLNFTKMAFNVENDSFLSITCVSGNGMINGEKMELGDTFFSPAGAGEITVEGDAEIIAVRLPK